MVSRPPAARSIVNRLGSGDWPPNSPLGTACGLLPEPNTVARSLAHQMPNPVDMPVAAAKFARSGAVDLLLETLDAHRMGHLVDLRIGAAPHPHFLRRAALLPAVEAPRPAGSIAAEEEVHINIQPLLLRMHIGDQRENQFCARRGDLSGTAWASASCTASWTHSAMEQVVSTVEAGNAALVQSPCGLTKLSGRTEP